MSSGTYFLMVLGIFLAKCLGFGRNIVFASTFGANAYTDIYFQIFGIANFVFTGIGTALATLVIKNLNKSANSGEKAQKRYVSHFLLKIGGLTVAATALLYIAAEPIVHALLPGLDPSMMGVAREMLYIMLPSGLFIVIAYSISGVLQNNKVFFITSMMSLPYNVLIIGGVLLGCEDIILMSWITTLGWFTHILILLPDFYRKGFRFIYRETKNGELPEKERNAEVFYIFLSGMMFQMCFVFDKAAMSYDTGTATTINYASNFFVTIASIFVVAMSNVCFPSLSRAYEAGKEKVVRRITRRMIEMLFAVIVPFVLVAVFYGGDLMALLYERGKFSHAQALETGVLFMIYTLGVFGYVCQELFNKILYLGSSYRYPVLGSIAIMAVKPLINLWAAKQGVYMVAATTTALFFGYAVLIGLAMQKVIGRYFNKELGIHLMKILIAGGLAALVWILFAFGVIPLPANKWSFIPGLLLGGLVYLAALWALGMVRPLIEKIKDEE